MPSVLNLFKASSHLQLRDLRGGSVLGSCMESLVDLATKNDDAMTPGFFRVQHTVFPGVSWSSVSPCFTGEKNGELSPTLSVVQVILQVLHHPEID